MSTTIPHLPDPPAPDAPPRRLSPLVTRRLWLDPTVRFWWLATLAMFVLAAAIAIEEFGVWNRENRLLKEGVVVSAKVIEADGSVLPDKKVASDSNVTLELYYKEVKHLLRGQLAGRKELIITHQPVTIRIDPTNPQKWTYRSEPTSLFAGLIGAVLIVPLAIIGAIISLLRYKKLKRLWRFGPARQAVVIEVKQTALAPRSKLVRCTPKGIGDKRLYTVYVPSAVKRIVEGDTLWLIGSPDNAQHVAAAAWFE